MIPAWDHRGQSAVALALSSAGLAAMIPTWVAVVTGISLAILALAAIVIAAASVVAAPGVRGVLPGVDELTGPAAGGVRALVGPIRTQGGGLGRASRGLPPRGVNAAAAGGGG